MGSTSPSRAKDADPVLAPQADWEGRGLDRPRVAAMDDYPVDGHAWDAALTYRDRLLTYYLEIGIATQAIGTEVYRATAELP